MKPRKILAKALGSPANIRFAEMQHLVEAFGFQLLRVAGSHHIYGRSGTPEQINLQSVGGTAKPYQVRQLLRLVERYNLQLEDRSQ